MRAGPWLRTSGQAWKIDLGVGVIISSLAARAFLPATVRDGIPMLNEVLMPVCQIAAIFLLLRVRCASCGTSMGWWAATQVPLSKWYRELSQLSACPVCRDRGDGTKEPREAPSPKTFMDRRWR